MPRRTHQGHGHNATGRRWTPDGKPLPTRLDVPPPVESWRVRRRPGGYPVPLPFDFMQNKRERR
jgi:hypothetical protein